MLLGRLAGGKTAAVRLNDEMLHDRRELHVLLRPFFISMTNLQRTRRHTSQRISPKPTAARRAGSSPRPAASTSSANTPITTTASCCRWPLSVTPSWPPTRAAVPGNQFPISRHAMQGAADDLTFPRPSQGRSQVVELSVRGVIAGFLEPRRQIPAAGRRLHSTVPLGGGLSSSAALEVCHRHPARSHHRQKT